MVFGLMRSEAPSGAWFSAPFAVIPGREKMADEIWEKAYSVMKPRRISTRFRLIHVGFPSYIPALPRPATPYRGEVGGPGHRVSGQGRGNGRGSGGHSRLCFL